MALLKVPQYWRRSSRSQSLSVLSAEAGQGAGRPSGSSRYGAKTESGDGRQKVRKMVPLLQVPEPESVVRRSGQKPARVKQDGQSENPAPVTIEGAKDDTMTIG